MATHEHDISIGPDRWIAYVPIVERRQSAVGIDRKLEGLGGFLDALETICVADCCGLDAFCFWPEEIRQASVGRDVEQIDRALTDLAAFVDETPAQTFVSTRLNAYFDGEVLLQLVAHLRESLPRYTIAAEDPGGADAVRLMDELSETLEAITGSSGRGSFDPDDVRGPRAAFVVARDAASEAVGCGAFRPLTDTIAEVKRMYARPGTFRVGTAILERLEAEAVQMGYRTLWLETRRINERAVQFYLRRGYQAIPNYGKYVGNEAAVCFGKRLLAGPEKP